MQTGFFFPSQETICGNFDPEIWFDPREEDLAKSLCSSCPIRKACLAAAVSQKEEWGVWGGYQFGPQGVGLSQILAGTETN